MLPLSLITVETLVHFPWINHISYVLLVVYIDTGLHCLVSLQYLLWPSEVNTSSPRLLVWSGLAGYWPLARVHFMGLEAFSSDVLVLWRT